MSRDTRSGVLKVLQHPLVVEEGENFGFKKQNKIYVFFRISSLSLTLSPFRDVTMCLGFVLLWSRWVE